MGERGILFSGPMVRTILAGQKTQTRRLIDARVARLVADLDAAVGVRCPYGQVGDRLWVRETWGPCAGGVVYRSDDLVNGQVSCPDGGRWKPSIFMPRWASRITLEVTELRVERLQDISEDDARAEGVLPFGEAYSSISRDQPITCGDGRPSFRAGDRPYAASFAVLWDTINGDRVLWGSNPWVWVVGFKRVEVARG